MACLDDNVIAAFVARGLADDERRAVVGHLDACDACMTIACAIARGDGSEALAGPVAGRYRLISMIGRGATGRVYLAEDPQLDRQVALKIVRGADRARWSREARAMAQVKHPNVVTVYDAGELDDGVFIAMELIAGDTLAAWLATPHDWREIVRVLAAAGRGLDAAHAAGIIHRDFKPANVLVDRSGRACVTDFGLASVPAGVATDVDSLTLTRTGAVVGTPRYMSPEQHRGDKVDARSDQFSFALVLYEALYQKPAFPRDSYAELKAAVLAGDLAPRPADSPLPVALHAVLVRALATDPDARFPSIAALLDDLERIARPRRTARLALGLAALACAGAGLAWIALPAAAPEPHRAGPAPRIAVLVDHLANRANEPLFDDTIETALVAGLYESTRIDPYGGAQLGQLAKRFGAEPTVDAIAGALTAHDGNPAVVVSGSIERDATGYAIVLAVQGEELRAHAASLDATLAAAAELAIALRIRLGDPGPVRPMSRSLRAVRELAIARQLDTAGDFAGALPHLESAVAADPDLAAAHAALAITLYNLSRVPQAGVELERALRDRDGMPERVRLALLSDYYGMTGRYVEAIAAAEQLLAKWPGDARTEVDIAATAIDAGMWPLALELARRAAANQPDIAVARANLILAEVANGRIDDAIGDGRAMLAQLPHVARGGFVFVAMAEALAGDRAAARRTLDRLAAEDAVYADQARADLLIYEGRLDDAEAVLRHRVDPALARGAPLDVHQELIALARLLVRRGDLAGARAIGAAANTEDTPLGRYLVATTLLDAGDPAAARELARAWAEHPTAETRLYAKLVDGDLARAAGAPTRAVAAYAEATQIADSWLARARLGLGELAAGRHADAIRDLRACLDRRGEAVVTATPSLSLLPDTHLALARALDAAHDPGARDAYLRVLALAADAQHDPVTDAARARLATLE